MKRGFSLIETAFGLVILGILFSFFYANYAQFARNLSFFSLNQALYDEEKEINHANTQNITLFVENLGELKFTQKFNEKSKFKLKSLSPGDENYKADFR